MLTGKRGRNIIKRDVDRKERKKDWKTDQIKIKNTKFEKHNQNRCSHEREEDQIGNTKAKENRVSRIKPM